jgi:hypothetical protein
MSLIYDYHAAPGHLIRRAHQLAVSIFAEKTAVFEITPVQFAMHWWTSRVKTKSR